MADELESCHDRLAAGNKRKITEIESTGYLCMGKRVEIFNMRVLGNGVYLAGQVGEFTVPVFLKDIRLLINAITTILVSKLRYLESARILSDLESCTISLDGWYKHYIRTALKTSMGRVFWSTPVGRLSQSEHLNGQPVGTRYSVGVRAEHCSAVRINNSKVLEDAFRKKDSVGGTIPSLKSLLEQPGVHRGVLLAMPASEHHKRICDGVAYLRFACDVNSL
ncbi:hypothetical protein BC832DRAFT_541998 [Gaertneriomyces semiglobifer]|nr:hypothetical protein BC832DRAFT_541998 [Gaertneriomyces semiglobifer]